MIYHTVELLQEIENLLNQTQGGKDLVILVGEKNHEELSYWYNSVDFILSASHYEGSGIAVCEAMSCGCIPILTDILSFRKMTDQGNCGILYPVGNEELLVAALTRAIGLDREKEIEKVLNQFHQTLSFSAIASQIAAISDSLFIRS